VLAGIRIREQGERRRLALAMAIGAMLKKERRDIAGKGRSFAQFGRSWIGGLNQSCGKGPEPESADNEKYPGRE